MICVVCGAEFERPNRKSKRQTCSRACWASFGWRHNRDQRIASIKATLGSPKQRARISALNLFRWAKPGAREKLSAWNRERWSDERVRAELSRAIAEAWTPEHRAGMAAIRTEEWRTDRHYREATIAGIRRSKRTPEARALFSALLKRRWQDPVWREKWIAGFTKARNRPETKAKQVAFRKFWWEQARLTGRRPNLPPVAADAATIRATVRSWGIIFRGKIDLWMVNKAAEKRGLPSFVLKESAPDSTKKRNCLRCGAPVEHAERGFWLCEYCRTVAAAGVAA
jgi:hypothetical protein